MHVCMYVCVHTCSVMSDSLLRHGLQPTRLVSWVFSRQEYWTGLPCSSHIYVYDSLSIHYKNYSIQ